MALRAHFSGLIMIFLLFEISQGHAMFLFFLLEISQSFVALFAQFFE